MLTRGKQMLDQINLDIKSAMKNKEKEKLQALRYLKSMLMENSTSKKPQPELDVIVRHHKKIKESISSYPESHQMREEAIQELKFVEAYLPKQLTEEQVKELINEIKSNLPSPNMGSIMKELTPKIKGQFDGKKASELVKAAL